MSRVYLGFVIALGLLLVIDIDVRGVIGLAALLLIMGAALPSILAGKIHRPLLHSVAVVILGPVVVCCIIKVLLALFHGLLNPTTGNSVLPVLILAGLMTASFLYVRVRLRTGRQHNQREMHTNERQPLPPDPDEGGEEQ